MKVLSSILQTCPKRLNFLLIATRITFSHYFNIRYHPMPRHMQNSSITPVYRVQPVALTCGSVYVVADVIAGAVCDVMLVSMTSGAFQPPGESLTQRVERAFAMKAHTGRRRRRRRRRGRGRRRRRGSGVEAGRRGVHHGGVHLARHQPAAMIKRLTTRPKFHRCCCPSVRSFHSVSLCRIAAVTPLLLSLSRPPAHHQHGTLWQLRFTSAARYGKRDYVIVHSADPCSCPSFKLHPS